MVGTLVNEKGDARTVLVLWSGQTFGRRTLKIALYFFFSSIMSSVNRRNSLLSCARHYLKQLRRLLE